MRSTYYFANTPSVPEIAQYLPGHAPARDEQLLRFHPAWCA
jgi:hypothetical protein